MRCLGFVEFRYVRGKAIAVSCQPFGFLFVQNFLCLHVSQHGFAFQRPVRSVLPTLVVWLSLQEEGALVQLLDGAIVKLAGLVTTSDTYRLADAALNSGGMVFDDLGGNILKS